MILSRGSRQKVAAKGLKGCPTRLGRCASTCGSRSGTSWNFCRDKNHVSPKWPVGYWPKPDEAGNAALWKETVEKFRGDLKQIEDLVSDASTDLFARIPHGTGQTIVREVLLIADHNANHLGALVVIGRMIR
jgi:hypothetical protein